MMRGREYARAKCRYEEEIALIEYCSLHRQLLWITLVQDTVYIPSMRHKCLENTQCIRMIFPRSEEGRGSCYRRAMIQEESYNFYMPVQDSKIQCRLEVALRGTR